MLKSVETVNNYVAQFFFTAYGMYHGKYASTSRQRWRISRMFTTTLHRRCAMKGKEKCGKTARHVCACVYARAQMWLSQKLKLKRATGS